MILANTADRSDHSWVDENDARWNWVIDFEGFGWVEIKKNRRKRVDIELNFQLKIKSHAKIKKGMKVCGKTTHRKLNFPPRHVLINRFSFFFFPFCLLKICYPISVSLTLKLFSLYLFWFYKKKKYSLYLFYLAPKKNSNARSFF